MASSLIRTANRAQLSSGLIFLSAVPEFAKAGQPRQLPEQEEVYMTAIKNLLLMAFVAFLGLAACSPVYRNHGFVPPEADLAQVVVGQTTQGDLQGLIGRPSAQGLLTGAGWYYVGSRWRYYGALQPREIQREVVAISFTPDGVVSNVERFGQERGRVVVLSRRVTEGSVTEISLIGQLLGNLGNFQAADMID